MTMHRTEAAALLDNCQYREEGNRVLFADMKAARLVAVFGASDDLMEFEGAVRDEVGAWSGATAYLNRSGLMQNECSDDDCPHFKRMLEGAATIHAIWCPPSGGSWAYETTIPHATFRVMEDDDLYCTGIVFSLDDVPGALA